MLDQPMPPRGEEPPPVGLQLDPFVQWPQLPVRQARVDGSLAGLREDPTTSATLEDGVVVLRALLSRGLL